MKAGRSGPWRRSPLVSTSRNPRSTEHPDVEALLLDLTRRVRHEARWVRATITFDVGRYGAWGLILDSGRAAVTATPQRDPDLLIRTSPETLADILLARRPGYMAFLDGDLEVRGNIALALELESLFDPPGPLDPAYPVTIHPKIGRIRWSVLAAGPPGASPVLLMHGLGSSKVSFLSTLKDLSRDHRVYALDMPGFGDSAKPVASYDAPWFADRVVELMDSLSLSDTFLVGNSMGGRIALELAFHHPDRVRAMALLCPALGVNWFRQAVPLVRLARAEFAALPISPSRARVMRTLRSIFADPDRLPALWLDTAADEFFRVYNKPRGRMAFYAAARSIYLDEPHGEQGLWTRMEDLLIPSQFIFGAQDNLVPAAYASTVADAFPDARIAVFDDCGHVPQVEMPERTNRLIRALFT